MEFCMGLTYVLSYNFMKISIIIPTYKPQAYIWECLDSIKNQTFPKEDFEVILVLNGCNEPYYSQIKEYIDKNFVGYNVNFIQTDQGGVSNARNIGLDNATGEYIAFIDDDDYISPKYLECLYDKAAPDTISLCYPYAFNDGKPEIQLKYPITKVYDEYHTRTKFRLSSKVRKYFSGPWMKLIPMSFIQDRRFDIRFKNGEDSLFMFSISDKISTIAFTSKDAIYYRRYRDGSAVMKARSTRERISNNINCIKEYTKIYFSGKYDLLFYISRIIAEMRCVFYAILKK